MNFRKEYNFLSNFYPAKVTYEDITYPSVEHAFVAAKTLDLEERKPILSMTASQAKRYGRTVTPRKDWKNYRLLIMAWLVTQKFESTWLAKKLMLITKPIVEDNYWHDNFWGNCEHCPGTGRNELGHILTQIRKELMK